MVDHPHALGGLAEVEDKHVEHVGHVEEDEDQDGNHQGGLGQGQRVGKWPSGQVGGSGTRQRLASSFLQFLWVDKGGLLHINWGLLHINWLILQEIEKLKLSYTHWVNP